MKIKVAKITGEYCCFGEDGQKLYQLIKPHLLAGQTVKLDFKGVKVYSSNYFNYAIGQLFGDVSVDDFQELVTFTNISVVGLNVVNVVLMSAVEYYAKKLSH
jgi:STAS-like domain of unknown function (DUF4325)